MLLYIANIKPGGVSPLLSISSHTWSECRLWHWQQLCHYLSAGWTNGPTDMPEWVQNPSPRWMQNVM